MTKPSVADYWAFHGTAAARADNWNGSWPAEITPPGAVRLQVSREIWIPVVQGRRQTPSLNLAGDPAGIPRFELMAAKHGAGKNTA